MPSPSDSSSVASGSRGWSDSRRGFSGRGPGGARLLLYLGLCHLSLGAMVLAFSFTSMAFTSSARVRQSCPFWAGFFVVASGIVGIISWRRPLTLVVSLFMLLSAVCVILSLAGSMLSCQNAQMVKSMLTCEIENGRCVCCVPTEPCSSKEDGTLVLNLNSDCHSVRHQLKLAPHRSRSVNPECTTPQDAFLTNVMDFEEFVPPIPPPPYYPPEYTCSSETDAQSITYNGSMESPIPLYPTDCPPPYEAVMGQRALSQATMFDQHGAEMSAERATSMAFSGEVSMDSGSLLMSEIVDIPDDSSPSEDSCLLEVALRNQGGRASRTASEVSDGPDGGTERLSLRAPRSQTPESPLAGGPRARRFLRGERSNSCSSPSTATTTYRSPVLRRQVMLARSCSQLEATAGSASQEKSPIPDIQVRPSTPLRQAGAHDNSEQCVGQNGGPPLQRQTLYLRRRAGRNNGESGRNDNEGLLSIMRSRSEPCLSSSIAAVDLSYGCNKASPDTGPSNEALLLPPTSLPPATALPTKDSLKSTDPGVQVPSKAPPASPLRLPKDYHRSLGDLKVTRVLMARFLQRSKRNLAPSSEHAGSAGQVPKRRGGAEGAAANHLSLEQVWRTPWSTNRGQPNQHPHQRTHHHSHSDSRHNRSHSGHAPEGIHLRSCGDLNSSSSLTVCRVVSPHLQRGSSGVLYSESAL
ncbi:protein ENTREP3 isoform X2 [Hippocampus zosterae]|uniref:protein ENTREP3 isoform X2 n=1 Tax=Hippocampus zosterae TaxID=109293 RepID=UPI00223DAC6A|nr:protein ENTREP3 isoform X2 [Hippocampus zosterae]